MRVAISSARILANAATHDSLVRTDCQPIRLAIFRQGQSDRGGTALLLLTKETQYFAGEIVGKAELALYFRVGGEQLLIEPDQTGTEPAIVWSSLVIRGARSKASGRLLGVVIQGQALARGPIRRTNRLGRAMIRFFGRVKDHDVV